MAQGIRTINGYTNNYPTVTSSSASWAIDNTAVWNTTYVHTGDGTVTSISVTIPTYAVADGSREIRICFKAGTGCTFTPNTSNFTTTYGIEDIEITAGNAYEISFVPLSASILSVVCKEWS